MDLVVSLIFQHSACFSRRSEKAEKREAELSQLVLFQVKSRIRLRVQYAPTAERLQPRLKFGLAALFFISCLFISSSSAHSKPEVTLYRRLEVRTRVPQTEILCS